MKCWAPATTLCFLHHCSVVENHLDLLYGDFFKLLFFLFWTDLAICNILGQNWKELYFFYFTASEQMWGRISVISPSHSTSWVSKQSFCIFTSLSLTIHIPHVILAHVAFNAFFTNQVFVAFNEDYFTLGTRTICRTDVRNFSTAAASVWTKDSKRCYFVRGGYIFNTIQPSKSWRCKRSG